MSWVSKYNIIQHILWKRIQQGKIKVYFNLKTAKKEHLRDQAKVRR